MQVYSLTLANHPMDGGQSFLRGKSKSNLLVHSFKYIAPPEDFKKSERNKNAFQVVYFLLSPLLRIPQPARSRD
jgi:hypothetical protein